MIHRYIIALLTASTLSVPAVASEYNSEDRYSPPVQRTVTGSGVSIERSSVAGLGFHYEEGSYVRVLTAPPAERTAAVSAPVARQAFFLRDESGIAPVLR